MSKPDIFNELPAEVRLRIFRLATLKPGQTEDTHVDYRPFEAVPLRDRDYSHSTQLALNIKLTIILVCKEWNSIATEMLYECLRIHHGTHELLDALERHTDTFDYGRWVRRIVISPQITDFDPFNPLVLCRILERCPLVETIVRQCIYGSGGISLGEALGLPPDTTFPTLPSLKRIDWWLPGITHRSQDDSIFSGFLGKLVANAPSLQYLTLSGHRHLGIWDLFDISSPIFWHDFSSVTTLRLECDDEHTMAQTRFSLPNLTHLILGGVYTSAESMFSTHGHKIRVLEFVRIVSFTYSVMLSPAWTTKQVLEACPNIEELSAPLGMGVKFRIDNPHNTIHLKSLKCIRIRLDDPSPFFPHFGYFIRDQLVCPTLERIVLHGAKGAWKENMSYPLFETCVSRTQFSSLEIVNA